MKVNRISITALLLLLLCAASVSAGIGGKTFTHRQHSHSSSTSLDGNTDSEAEFNITTTHLAPTEMSGLQARRMAAATYGRSLLEAVVVGRPHVDFDRILQQGDVTEILLVLCHPSRLIRSVLLSWVAAEVWRQCGLFQRPRRPKKQRQGTRYRRFTSTRKTYQKQIKGVLEEALDEEQFQPEYAASSRRGKQSGKSSDTFSNIVPESQEKGNSLTKSQKESLLKEYEVSRPKSRLKLKTSEKKGRLRTFLRLTRKKKFRVAWSLGHMMSPCLLTPMGGALAGWLGLLCIGAELIPWVDKKFKLDVLEDNEVLEWLLEPFRDNEMLQAILFGSLVGACYSNI